MLEFAIAWPICLVIVAGCIQLSTWGAESYAARQAALAGARSATAAGASADTAATVTIAALGRSLLGAHIARWCPGSAGAAPDVWVCATAGAGVVEVRVGGSVPALLSLVPGGTGLPIGADVVLGQEAFQA